MLHQQLNFSKILADFNNGDQWTALLLDNKLQYLRIIKGSLY